MSNPSPGQSTLKTLIPIPGIMTPADGTFRIDPTTQILIDPDIPTLRQIGETLAALLPVSGHPLAVKALPAGEVSGCILLTTRDSQLETGADGYRLDIQPQGVAISASQPAGLFYGVQTLRQLLPPAVEPGAGHAGPWELSAVQIVDQPRFAWRGFMLDVSRHFFDVQVVKKLVDYLAAYKLNRLHLHLSDDQGWRIEIKSLPDLTKIGGSTQVGGGQGGFYSQEALAEIVAYAQSRFITVIPEIEMPGHTHAALASYPELNTDGQAPDLFTGTGVGFSSLSIRKELTYQFIDTVIGELAAITPGDFIHIGGDEAWSTSHEDYLYFIERVQEIVQAHGKRMVGWGEIAQARLKPSTLVQHWVPGSDPAPALQQGARLILSPANHIYLDMKYDENTVLGLNWAGYVNTRAAYEWDPAALLPGVLEETIAGIEGPLWTETIETLTDIETMIFPRLVGLAEIAWSPQACRSWEAYRQRLGEHASRFLAMGIHYYPDPEVPWR